MKLTSALHSCSMVDPNATCCGKSHTNIKNHSFISTIILQYQSCTRLGAFVDTYSFYAGLASLAQGPECLSSAI